MKPKEFLKTRYAQQLMADFDHMEKDVERFNETWLQFWERSTEDLGTILICHLAIEHYLNEWLTAANPGIAKLSKTRLSFTQKLSLIDKKSGNFPIFFRAIEKINNIRNKLVHNMVAELSDTDLQPIRDVVWPWHEASGRPCREGIALIEDFALLVSGMLCSQADAIRRYGKGAGLVVYERWVRDAMAVYDDNSQR